MYYVNLCLSPQLHIKRSEEDRPECRWDNTANVLLLIQLTQLTTLSEMIKIIIPLAFYSIKH